MSAPFDASLINPRVYREVAGPRSQFTEPEMNVLRNEVIKHLKTGRPLIAEIVSRYRVDRTTVVRVRDNLQAGREAFGRRPLLSSRRAFSHLMVDQSAAERRKERAREKREQQQALGQQAMKELLGADTRPGEEIGEDLLLTTGTSVADLLRTKAKEVRERGTPLTTEEHIAILHEAGLESGELRDYLAVVSAEFKLRAQVGDQEHGGPAEPETLEDRVELLAISFECAGDEATEAAIRNWLQARYGTPDPSAPFSDFILETPDGTQPLREALAIR